MQPCRPGGGRVSQRGAALVEFALVSLVLYLIVAGAVEFGRLMFAANAIQDIARVAARELALAPVSASLTFDDALSCDGSDPTTCPNVKGRVFDPACLVVDLNDPAVAPDPDGYFAAMPVVNRAMRTLMISEPSAPNLLRYPGAALIDGSGASCSAIGPNGQASATGLTVGIPLVAGRDPNGAETIAWVPVLQEIRAAQDADCPAAGPFSLVDLTDAAGCGTPAADHGVVAVRINYPYQAAMLSAFTPALPTDTDPNPPNWANVIVADDGSVQELNAPPGDPIDLSNGGVGAYAGPFGLGRHFAFAGKTVRPFRRVISAQAIFRREVFE